MLTPTLFTSCNALPPEGAELARGGPSLRSLTPLLATTYKYLITIVMPDGSHGRCHGMFQNDWQAIDCMMAAFFDARRISARRLA